MRIISGKLKGRRFLIPNNIFIRPTTDFAKESLFNILNYKIIYNKIKVLDLFCGSGNISYEFASRGVQYINCVDNNIKCIKFIYQMINKFAIYNQIFPIKKDIFKFLKQNQLSYDLIFLDPPYKITYQDINIIINLIIQNNWLCNNGLIILEHIVYKKLFHNNPYYIITKKYGYVNFSFFKYF